MRKELDALIRSMPKGDDTDAFVASHQRAACALMQLMCEDDNRVVVTLTVSAYGCEQLEFVPRHVDGGSDCGVVIKTTNDFYRLTPAIIACMLPGDVRYTLVGL